MPPDFTTLTESTLGGVYPSALSYTDLEAQVFPGKLPPGIHEFVHQRL